MKLIIILLTFSIVFLPSFIIQNNQLSIIGVKAETNQDIWDADIIICDSKDPYKCLLASTIACYYPFQDNTSTLTPLLLAEKPSIQDQHKRFINSYMDDPLLLCFGVEQLSQFQTITYQESAPKLSFILASKFPTHSEVVIIPYGLGQNYTIALQGTLLSSYLHIPLLIFQDNAEEINGYLQSNTIKNVYLFGDIDPDIIEGNNKIILNHEQNISFQILQIIKDQFKSLNYITITNPSDIIKPKISLTTIEEIKQSVFHQSITLYGKTITLNGESTYRFNISIPKGIHHLECMMKYNSNISHTSMQDIEPLVYCTLKDPDGTIIGYGQSSGFEIGGISLDTLIVDHPGNYSLEIIPYHGLKGGYFSSRGFSFVSGNLEGTMTYKTMNTSHLPRVESLSVLAPYLTAAYGGYLIANESFSLTNPMYDTVAKGYGTGPWYEEHLHEFNNQMVNVTIDEIQKHLDYLNQFDLYQSFEQSAAWLAILGDTNMIPMYYYQPSQFGLIDKGLASDNPYSFHETFSIGRIMGYSLNDVSNLICRTLFYQSLLDETTDIKWKDTFHFMYGEGFGETGGWFHQIPYSKEIEKYGFSTEVFGDFKNSRQYAERHQIFTDANYNEFLGHGDWFWFAPSWYGFDVHMRAFDVANLKDWIFDYPSVFLTSACLMGRVDGIPPTSNIGMTLLHAGCNAFVGATRETGQEAGLEILENSMILNDTSIGEALREEKTRDQGLPTYYVRVLYGDPAFNPYEPNNGVTIERKPSIKDQ